MSKRPYLVGISGGSASGKTSFLKHLRAALPENSTCVVSQDNYYLPQDQQLRDENGQINFDLPTSIHRDAFYSDMIRLSKGETIEIQEYTFNNAARIAQTITLEPAPVIIMEGLFIFHYEEIKNELDLRIYIEAREDIKLNRRLRRDKDERGYPEDVVMYQWHNHVMPSYRQFLQPYRDDSDIIVTNNTSYDKALEVVIDHLMKHL
ncbi:MAG: uridine-cytidine kinase [Bacteroidia bacterium]